MYTEIEAKEKMCHTGAIVGALSMLTVTTGGGDLSNMEVLATAMGHCQGSECMKWRWNPGNALKGYCGLAGKPNG